MTSRKPSKNEGDCGTGVYMQEGTTSRMMVADRLYGEFYGFTASVHSILDTPSYIYITCFICKPPNVAPISCNFLTCRLGAVPAHYTKCMTYPRINFVWYFNKATQTQVNLHTIK
jgi:hypothetical protein